MILHRDQTKEIKESSRSFPVVAVVGPRQSGKTTLAKAIFENHVYVSLEDMDVRAAANADPRTFLISHRNEYGMIIDEFQYIPELLTYIKTIVDTEQKPGFFILTGSQNFLMSQAITQSLAGRVAIHTLLPLSIHELQKNDLLPQEIETMLYNGCYPAVYAKKMSPKKVYKNYFKTYLERDVQQLTQVGDLMTFQTFITACAMRAGQLLNVTSLANDCGMSDSTAKRWLSILQASYIIFLVKPYHKQFGKRLTKAPKLHFYDSGLLCSLLKIKPEEVAAHPLKGHIFESFVISEILKWYYNHDEEPNIYFWRDSHGVEIDCIIEEGLRVIPLEIKISRTIMPKFFENLNYIQEIAPKKSLSKGFIIFGGSQSQTRSFANAISWQNIDSILKT